MRSPRQLERESADFYRVMRPIRIEPGYEPNAIVEGDVARSWSTFRALLSIGWLIPTPASSPPAIPAAPHKAAGGRHPA